MLGTEIYPFIIGLNLNLISKQITDSQNRPLGIDRSKKFEKNIKKFDSLICTIDETIILIRYFDHMHFFSDGTLVFHYVNEGQ